MFPNSSIVKVWSVGLHTIKVSMAPLALPYVTPAEYLAAERTAAEKSEYINGHVYAMAGASRVHNLIVVNTVSELRTQLRGGRCEAYANDMRVKVERTGIYTYPDVIGLCEEPRFEDENVDTLLNPTVIIEVLSPSTERCDRGEKFAHYRRLESLREYILVAQDIRPDRSLSARWRHLGADGSERTGIRARHLLAFVHPAAQRHVRPRGAFGRRIRSPRVSRVTSAAPGRSPV